MLNNNHLGDHVQMDKLLMWDKPQKAQSVTDWKNSYGFEDGPAGGYVPNMSDQDAARWKAKLVGKTTPYPQVEIRKTSGSTQLLMIVSLGQGYNYKSYKAVPSSRGAYATQGVNVHMALNGGLQLTFEEMHQMHAVVQEAKEYLENLSTTSSNNGSM